MSDYEHDISDNEEFIGDNNISKQIQAFTVRDYLKCKETRDILVNDFYEKFEENIETSMKDLFLNFYYALNGKFSGALYRADEEHVEDFLSLLKYHIRKDYNINLFKENPELAKPLIEQIEDIRIQDEKQKQKLLNKKLSRSIYKQRKFKWNVIQNDSDESDYESSSDSSISSSGSDSDSD